MAWSKNHYKLPLDLKEITHWHQSVPAAHKGYLKHAFDFYALEGTPIYAAQPGKVVWLRRGSKVGGINKKKYWDKGNRIVLKHSNNEYSAYEHMKYGGVLVKVGQKVRKGQLIGYVGTTGYTHAPHLHFEVFTNPDKWKSEGETLQVSFGIPRKGKCVKEECYG
jgi:murein DD-endopeptidase MepM/ murein hydrolase activator NlpD